MRSICMAFGIFCLVFTVCDRSPAASEAEDKSSVKDLVDKVLEAHGGIDKLKQIESVHMKMKTKYNNGDIVSTDLLLQPPDHLHMVMVEKGDKPSKDVRILNGDKGTIEVNGKKAEATPEQVKELKARVHRLRIITLFRTLTGSDLQLSLVPEIKVGEHAAVGLKVQCKGEDEVTLYFDKKTSHLLKSEGKVRRLKDDKEVMQETFYSGYKDVGDGIMRPSKMKVLREGKPAREVEILEEKLSKKK